MSCVYEVISSLKHILKVKLNLNIYPNILSEIIGLHENEGRSGRDMQYAQRGDSVVSHDVEFIESNKHIRVHTR